MENYIKTFNNVLSEYEHKYLLELCDKFIFQNLDSPGEDSYYHMTGNRYHKFLTPDDGDIFFLIHKAFVSTMPKIYEQYSKVLPDDLKFCNYSGYGLCKYIKGSYLSYHSDSDADAASLTGSFNINDNYSGGDLIFWDNYKIEKESNSIHVYPSSLTHPHRVDPVTEGVRYSAIVWFAYEKGYYWGTLEELTQGFIPDTLFS